MNPIKTELYSSHAPTASAGIQPEKRPAEQKGETGNPKTADHRACFGS